jgi:hypothetical protein
MPLRPHRLHLTHRIQRMAAFGLLAALPTLAKTQAPSAPPVALRCMATSPSESSQPSWQNCQGPLSGHQLHLQAPANQVLLLSMDGGHHAHRIQLFGPDGQLLRQWPAVHNGRQEIGWITSSAGHYYLQADNPYFSQHHAPDALPPRWTLRANGPAQADTLRPATPPAVVSSPLLLQLTEHIKQADKEQKADFIANFWRTIRTQGTPLLEPLAQPQEILATFLWRAPEGTAEQPHHVRLDWPIRSSEPFQLQRLAGTDIWHISVPLPRGMRAAYQLVVNPVRYPAAVGQVVDRFERAQVQQLTAQRDALNPHMWHAGSPELPSGPAALHAHRSVLDLATGMGLQNQATDQVWPPLAGSLQHLQFHSRQLGNTRSLSLYLPPGSHAQASLPLLILFDREAYLERVQLPQRLERWVAQGQIQPHALLLVSNPTRDHRAKELPPHSPAFGQMLSTELMPWLYAQQPALARDASQVTVAGSSYGGLAAAYLAWSHPESFGKVLSLSGSFWWSPTPVSRSYVALERR